VTRRGAWLLSGAVGAALALSAVVPALRGVAGVGSPAGGPLYETRRGEFVRTVHAEGNLTAAEATQLGPPSRRRHPLTIAWLAPDGSRVREGDVVIRFDPTDMERNRDEGESERSQADSRISKQRVREDSAVRNLDRDAGMADLELEYAREFQSKDREIFSRAEVIESEIDQNLASERKDHAEDVREIRGELGQVELDLLGIERRKAELKVQEAREGLQELEVRAPHDGIFVLKQVWGRYPEVGQMVWQGNAIAEIPRLGVMEAEIYVLEADAGGLEVDLPARVTLEAHPDRVYDATIRKVDALAQPRLRQVPVQYFGVMLELERTDPEVMKPGQRVMAELFLGERDDVVTVPRQAIFESEGRTVVYALRGGDFEPLEVELGPASLGRVVIDSGLEEGERVALFDPTRPTQEPADEGSDAGTAPGGGLAGSLR
jgi:multidrug efflux pump subunit AcrA (membrane-fusion protein)